MWKCLWYVYFFFPALLFCLDIQQLAEERVKNGGSTAIVIAIVDGSKTAIYSYGQLSASDSRPVNAETLFEIGSITKVFTTILLQEKVLKGEVTLQDPVEKYLPNLHLPQKNGIEIDFQHLATHTSGLPYSPTNYVIQSISNPFSGYTKEEFISFLHAYELPREPGQQYEYSNVGLGLLGNVLADLAKTDFETLVKTHICFPLGMKSTSIRLTKEMATRLAKGHMGKKEVSNWDLPAFPGAGALRSSANDLVRFLKANMGLLSTSLYNSMRESHQRLAATDDPEVDVGLGWHIMHRFFPEIVWHNGGTGGYRSFLGFCPNRQRGVIILSNSSTEIDDIGFFLLDERYPLKKGTKEIFLDPSVLQEYVGKYRHRLGLFCTVYCDRGKLFVQVKGFPDAQALPASENQFFFKEVSAQISFEFNSSRERVMIVTYGDQRYVFKKFN